MISRVCIIVLDSLGIGALPDAANYGDSGSNTLLHIYKAYPDLNIPNLRALGIGNINGLEEGKLAVQNPAAAYVRLGEASKGKDTITGHWEIAGLRTEVPFKTREKFPDDFMRAFEKRIGRETIGNYAASGTEIIESLGEEHEKTGKPIIYTSADSVFQIAANTAVIPLEELYKICEIAREMLTGDLQTGRVIARPYILKDGKRARTSDRKDYAVSPPEKTLLDNVKDAGKTVYAVGKIHDIFNGSGITTSVHIVNNMDGVDKTIDALKSDVKGLIFTNLVDFDSLYGHRRDPVGYGHCIEDFDRRLPEIIGSLRDDDILILCADHGNDPTHTGWDHTREAVPCLVYGKQVKPVNLGVRDTFADIAETVADALGVPTTENGASFLGEILK